MLEIILIILLIVLIILALVILYYVRHPKRYKRKEPIVDPKTARRSRIVLKELRAKFQDYYRRYPNSSELVRLIIMTSHIVIRGNTLWAHWMRWRIRLFLASENGVWYGTKPANSKTLANVFGTVK